VRLPHRRGFATHRFNDAGRRTIWQTPRSA
jgi:hypothetical protein